MTIDYTALRNELNTDPQSLGYAPFISAGQDQNSADLLNALTGNGAATITLSLIDKGQASIVILSGALTLASLSNTLQAKWVTILQAAAQLPDPIPFENSIIQTVLGSAVNDGVLTDAQINSFTQRTGSRAEVLFGQNTIIGNLDVAKALRG